MTENQENPPRPMLLTLVLLGVLGLSVGAAWLLTQSRQGPVAAGAEILAQIRQKGLQAYWPNDSTQSFYIQRRGGKPINWSITYRRPQGEAFEGVELVVGALEIRSNWQLADNLSAGQYQSRVMNRQHVQQEDTEIVYEGGQLKVTRVVGPRGHVGSVLAPENYIPENSKELAIFEAIKQNRPVSYRIILDQQAVDDNGRVLFANFNVTPLGALKARCEIVTADNKIATDIYEFNEAGEMIGIESANGLSLKEATPGEVLREFPGSLETLERNGLLIREINTSPL